MDGVIDSRRFSGNSDLIDQKTLEECGILGLGGIGAPLTQLCSIIGFRKIVGHDYDYIEPHNLSATIYPLTAMGLTKSEAARNVADDHGCELDPRPKFDENSEISKIMFVCPDNIPVRELAYFKWKSYVDGLPIEERKDCVFVDMRMGALTIEVITISPYDEPDVYKKTLPLPGQVIPAPCTRKHTIFTGTTAAAIGVAQAVGYINKKAVNSYVKISYWPFATHEEGEWISQPE